MKNITKKPTVFISYSHADEKWKDRLLPHLRTLEQYDIISFSDDRIVNTNDEWVPAIHNVIDYATVAICLISADYLSSRFIIEQELPALIERRRSMGMLLLPIIVSPCIWNSLPILRSSQMEPPNTTPLALMDDLDQDQFFANIANTVYHRLGEVNTTLPKSSSRSYSIVSLNKLPATPRHIFGRATELALLSKTWESHDTNIVSFIAWGGTGKTSLVNYWLTHHMAHNDYGGAARVFGWSFYSQGTSDKRQASGEQFIDSALRFFGDTEMADSNASAWSKGAALAHLIGQNNNLLILDGLEPLQDPHDLNRIKDPAVAALLTNLAAFNKGLCVVTSRIGIKELEPFSESAVKNILLENLSLDAGTKLMRKWRIEGDDTELKEAVSEYNGHALALTLLSSYIRTAYAGDIRKRDRIPHLTDEMYQGAHAKHVMAAYERWFKGKPELQILYILGLFDRPVELAAIDAIKTGVPLEGLTDNLTSLSQDKWLFALKHLREVSLLLPSEQDSPYVLDCHPLIREYFGDRLKETNESAWQQAHSRLYEYFCDLPQKQLPDTIEEMTPLYRAIYHGCAAGLHQQALKDIYWSRITRGNQYYSFHKLGALGSDLAAVACFFDTPWHTPSPTLTGPVQALLLNSAAFNLRALGRLAESAQPFKASLDMAIAAKDWINAARFANNLNELNLTLGNISDAIIYGKQCVDLADKSDDTFEKIGNRTTLANALAQAGNLDDGLKLFAEAEQMQRDHQPEFPLLYGLPGYLYCDLLLDRSEYNQVLDRVKKFFEWRMDSDPLLAIALDNLSLGCAFLRKKLTENTGDFTEAAEYLNLAVDGLRKAGTQDHLPRGLLARAQLYRVTNNFILAYRDLDEAYALSTRIGTKLFEADCCLKYTCLYLAQGDTDNARKYFEQAEAIITETGYHRRDKDLTDLRSKLT